MIASRHRLPWVYKMFHRASLVLVSAVVFLACLDQTSAWV